MKIKAIAAICKKRKRITICSKINDNGEITQQYISDDVAIYPLEDLPLVDEKTILAIFDIPKSQRSELLVCEKSTAEVKLCLDDVTTDEKPIDYMDIIITYFGATTRVFLTSKGAVYINTAYFAPLGVKLEELEFYERTSPEGMPYIVAKSGLFAKAFFSPYRMNMNFTESLKNLALATEKFYKILKD